MADALNLLTSVLNSPENYQDDPILGPVALALLNDGQGKAPYDVAKAAPYRSTWKWQPRIAEQCSARCGTQDESR